ncbi:hypothetical protein ES702_00570 [subsurface metagenome]
MSKKQRQDPSDIDMFHQLDEVTKQINEAQDKLKAFEEILRARRTDLERTLADKADAVRWSRFRPEFLPAFIEEPYIIEPYRFGKGGDVIEWRVYIPKMVEFQVGRLERATHSYNVWTVNQYMRWFAEIPEELEGRFPQIEIELQVSDGLLMTDPSQTDQAWGKYRKFLLKREGPGAIKIKKGSEWELIAQILEDGGLPFAPMEVNPDDIRGRSKKGFALHEKWEMRDYQTDAWNTFLEYGAIGIYWPFGGGKSQFGLELCDRLKGPKLIIAGGSGALREQWQKRLEAMPPARRKECHVVLYQSRSEIDRLTKQYKQFTLIIFDESAHLPAKTFMRLSTIPTLYRLGLTGSPYREDGHINYIMALTGYPLGLAWSQFVVSGIITLAQVQVHVVKKQRHKLYILDQLLKRDLGKTIIFCDSLDLGDSVAQKYSLEWVHGATKNRIETIERNERVVVSRVGDEGLSIPEIDTVIEIDFLGGSRAQALQRAGRLQHRAIQPDQEPAVHHILMTEEELEKYGKRLLAYYDKGFKVDFLYGM